MKQAKGLHKWLLGHFLPISLLIISYLSGWPFFEGLHFSEFTLVVLSFSALIYISYKSKDSAPCNNTFLKVWIIYIIFQLIIGLFYINNYYVARMYLRNSLTLLCCYSIYLFSYPKYLFQCLHTWYKYFIPIFVICVIPVAIPETYFHFLIPLYIGLILIRALPFKHQVLILIVAIFFMGGLLSRSNLIKIIIFSIIGYVTYSKYITKKIAKLICAFLISCPLLLFILGISGFFNVFDMESYMGNYDVEMSYTSEGEERGRSMIKDTRTFVYAELLESTIENDSWLLGRHPSRGYTSIKYQDELDENSGMFNTERMNVEVGILGIYLWTGIIGYLIYSAFFFNSIFSSINRTNNHYILSLAIALSFIYAFSFVEFTCAPHIMYIMTFIYLGICNSKAFLNMSNDEFKIFIKKIFSFKS